MLPFSKKGEINTYISVYIFSNSKIYLLKLKNGRIKHLIKKSPQEIGMNRDRRLTSLNIFSLLV